jgi:hypothetical protein
MFTFKTNELITTIATALVWVSVWSFIDITMATVNIKTRAIGYLFILAGALITLHVFDNHLDHLDHHRRLGE